MTVFNTNDHHDIERYASGLSKDEVLDIWCTTYEELGQQDQDYFDRSYKKGRALAKALAVESLFKNMQGKNGVAGPLAYLVRVGDEWPNVTPGTTPAGQLKNGEGGFSFNVTMPNDG